MESVVGLLQSFRASLLDVGQTPPWRVVGTVGEVLHTGDAVGLETSDPPADRLSGGVPVTGRLVDAGGLQIGGRDPKSCPVLGHSAHFPVGQVCHTRSSSQKSSSHHPCSGEALDLATIFLTIW